jgi:hypothetical protein
MSHRRPQRIVFLPIILRETIQDNLTSIECCD